MIVLDKLMLWLCLWTYYKVLIKNTNYNLLSKIIRIYYRIIYTKGINLIEDLIEDQLLLKIIQSRNRRDSEYNILRNANLSNAENSAAEI